MNTLSKYALTALLGIGVSYNANALQFILKNDFSGGATPTGSLQVDITNAGTDTVQLKITSLLVGTEFVSDLYLNLDPALTASSLNFGTPTRTGTFGLDPVITTSSPPPLNADGGGTFDIRFAFDTAPPGDRFGSGGPPADSLTYTVTGITGLDETDFNFLSQPPSGGNGFFAAAAHIQGITPNSEGETSGFVGPTVPDGGSTVMLLGGALACLGALRRRLA
jgi:VPDSG-CTERM motif